MNYRFSSTEDATSDKQERTSRTAAHSSVPDKATEVERRGIEHIPSDERHGTPGRTFTLWFAANLTIADYVIGVLTTQLFGMTLVQALPVLLLGNLLGGLVLGLSGGDGPDFSGIPRCSVQNSFGRRGNYLPGALNWISTVGWFTVNTILGSLAIQALIPGANYYASAILLVAVQVLIAIYGHDFIHLFEKWMSVALGAIFLLVFLLAVPDLGRAVSIVPSGASATGAALGAIGTTLAASFSYIMSWSPYASDYSRYLSEKTSKAKVAAFALLGGAVASFAIEALGAIVGNLTGSLDYFVALRNFSGGLGNLILVALILGAIAANALNIYTNSLSALVLDVRTKRWITVTFGGIFGLGLSLALGSHFESFFGNFLLVLDYWITPWLGIILIDFFVAKRTTSESSRSAVPFDWGTLVIYAASVLASVPFMVSADRLRRPTVRSFRRGGFQLLCLLRDSFHPLLHLQGGREEEGDSALGREHARRGSQLPDGQQPRRCFHDSRDRVHHDCRGGEVSWSPARDGQGNARFALNRNLISRVLCARIHLNVECHKSSGTRKGNSILNQSDHLALAHLSKVLRVQFLGSYLWRHLLVYPVHPLSKRVADHRHRLWKTNVPELARSNVLLKLFHAESNAHLLLEGHSPRRSVKYSGDLQRFDARARAAQSYWDKVHHEARIHARPE